MRTWLKGLVLVAVGAAAANANAQDLQWHPADARTPAAVVALDRPVPQKPLASSASLLGRPLPLSSPSDPALTRASYNGSLLAAPQVIVRGQVEELHQPMPLGPSDGAKPLNPSDRGAVAAAPNSVTVLDSGGGILGDGATPGDCSVPGCGVCCDSCCSDGTAFWVSAEYLLWWINHSHTPALLTTSPPGTPTTTAGVLGLPTTSVVVGSNSLDQSTFDGGRFSAGYWFDDEHVWGIDGSYFFLSERTRAITDTSFGNPILVRPFFNVAPGTGTEMGELVAFPGVIAGSANFSETTRLWGADANIRRNFLCLGNWKIDLLAGARYFKLDENLDIGEGLLVTAPGVLSGSTITVGDHFGTKNTFYGGQIGAESEWRWGNFFIDGVGKIAFGDNHQTVDISGSTSFMLPTGVTTVQPGGLLALPTNSGHFSRDKFAILPEVGAKVGYQFTPHIRAYVGYTCILLTDAVRPGQEIDRVINTTQLPTSAGPGTLVGPARPAFAFHDTNFWAQGIDFGVEFRY
jgi:hypothetical protein